VSVIVDQLVFSLCDGLSDLLADINELLRRVDDPGVDKVEFGRKGFWNQRDSKRGRSSSHLHSDQLCATRRSKPTSELLHERLIRRDVGQRDLAVWVLGRQVILRPHWREERGHRAGERGSRGQERCYQY